MLEFGGSDQARLQIGIQIEKLDGEPAISPGIIACYFLKNQHKEGEGGYYEADTRDCITREGGRQAGAGQQLQQTPPCPSYSYHQFLL